MAKKISRSNAGQEIQNALSKMIKTRRAERSKCDNKVDIFVCTVQIKAMKSRLKALRGTAAKTT